MIGQTMTREEIERHFEGQWVLLDDVERNAAGNVVRGRLLWITEHRDEVERKSLEFHPACPAIIGPTRLYEGDVIWLSPLLPPGEVISLSSQRG